MDNQSPKPKSPPPLPEESIGNPITKELMSAIKRVKVQTFLISVNPETSLDSYYD